MKKALSLILALVLCLALAVPAFAVEQQANEPVNATPNGTFNPAGTDTSKDPNEGVVGVNAINPDATVVLVPSVAPAAPDWYYHVRWGDTLEAIAFAFYGNVKAAAALKEANADGHFLVSKGVLEADRELRIPAKVGSYVRLPAAALYPVVMASTYIDAANGDFRVIYIVQPGETLGSIAETFYGNSATPILQAIINANTWNKNLTSTAVFAGQYIVLPVITVGI